MKVAVINVEMEPGQQMIVCQGESGHHWTGERDKAFILNDPVRLIVAFAKPERPEKFRCPVCRYKLDSR